MDTNWNDMPLREGDQEPHPVNILTQTHVWRKIGEKHMAHPWEPWDEWLGAPLTAVFRALWPLGCQTDADRGTVQDVSTRVREDAETALKAPLLRRYHYSRMVAASGPGSGGARRIGSLSPPETSQRLVLPNGAHAELRCSGGVWSMRSCYFDRNVANRDVPLWQRYRGFVNKLRTRYLVAPGDPTTSIIDPNLREDSIEVGIEFVSRYNWGLEPSNPPDPWNHLPAPWPQAPTIPAAPPAGLLSPPLPGGGTTP